MRLKGSDRSFFLPVLKKKEQFTLSFSVPKILARYSAIFIANLKIQNNLEQSDWSFFSVVIEEAS